MPDIISIIFAVVLGLIYPTYLYINRNKIRKILKDEKLKLKEYKNTIYLQWVMLILVLLNLLYQKQPFSQLGLTLDLNIFFLIGFGIILIGIPILFFTLKITADSGQNIKEKYGEIFHTLPANKEEYNWFLGVSVTAGICEEILYRGFLFLILSTYMHYVLAIILLNIAFGLLHVWSTHKNMLSAFFLGLLFSVVYMLTGSLILSILIHIMVDVYVGTLAYRTNKVLQLANLPE